ncbi:MAG: DUF4105 domain-containing protein [Bacteroidota bacterium]
MKLHKKVFFSLSLLLTFSGLSQRPELSSKAQISVLTCGAGSELYAAFGHTAFRIQDANLGIDYVYNYGTFDFDTPNFYSKFARGKLSYSLSGSKFSNFLYTYQLENRWVKEQLLRLNLQEKKDLFRFLENNRKPENRDYKYDFLFDNCSTKIPFVLKTVLGEKLVFGSDHLVSRFTFRELIHQNLKMNSWSSFGIDLALGAVIDKKASAKEHLFLPNYVLDQLNHTTLDGENLVERERIILDIENKTNGHYFTASPFFWLLLFMLFTATITYIDFKNDTRSRWLDFFLFFVTGIVGMFVFFLWFLTDHSATANNFNILWAFPLNSVVGFFLARHTPPPHWLSKYLMLLPVLLILTLLIWGLGIQRFPPLIWLVLITLGLRYAFLNHYFKNIHPNNR